MLTLRLFRTACACLTMCPFVTCGGDGGRVLTRQCTGVHSAWVSHPPSRRSFRESGSPARPTKTSRWTTAPRPSTSPVEGSPPARSFAPPSSSRERKRRSPAPALLCTLHRDEERHSPPPPPLSVSPLLPRLGGGAVRSARAGRGVGGFRLGAVTAVRSPGDGGGASAVVGGGEELKEAFDAAVGEEGLLGLAGFRDLPDVRELLEDGLLQDSEVAAIWKAVSKADASGDRVDFAGFCEAFTRVDSLFEEEEEEEGGGQGSAKEIVGAGVVGSAVGGAGEAAVEAGGEAEASFLELVGSAEGSLDLAGLLRWDEVTELVEEGLLTQQEVEQMWEGLPKVANKFKAAGAPGTEEGMLINLEGFLEFDRKLSDLFEDEEGDDEPAAAAVAAQQPPPSAESPPSTPPAVAAAAPVAVAPAPVVEEEAVDEDTPEGQFLKLSSGSGGVVTLDGLLGWTEVSELLEDDLMTREEMSTIFQALPKAKGRGSSSPSPAIDVKGFLEFARKLDEMFEEDADEDEDSATTAPLPGMKTSAKAAAPKEGNASEAKARLLSLSQAEMADCGMGCGEDKRTEMLEAMEALLATEEGNLVLGEDVGTGLIDNLVGEWRLLYTSSNAMEYNQGLTGLANTIPNAKFQGLRQILHADGMVFDAEYEEELVTGENSEPLIITVTSDWEVKQTSSLITGKSTVAVAVAPKQIKYGFITVRSERWKTLRAMMLLDIAYLDADLRIMRGQTARQNFFVFVRV